MVDQPTRRHELPLVQTGEGLTVGALSELWLASAARCDTPVCGEDALTECAEALAAALVPLRAQVARLEQEIRANADMTGVYRQIRWADALAAIRKALEP